MKQKRSWTDIWYLIKNFRWPDPGEMESKVKYLMRVKLHDNSIQDYHNWVTDEHFTKFIEWFMCSDSPSYNFEYDKGNLVFVRKYIVAINCWEETHNIKKENV